MNIRTLAAICLSLVIAALYFATARSGTAMITRLDAGGSFAVIFILAAVVSGFIGYTFAAPIQIRLVRRLVMIACLAFGLFACGNIGRAAMIARLFQQEVTRHQEALPVVIAKGAAIGLRSPYTGTVFDVPSTISAGEGLSQFALVGKCAKVEIEETARGDKRIAPDTPPVSSADIVTCPAQ